MMRPVRTCRAADTPPAASGFAAWRTGAAGTNFELKL